MYIDICSTSRAAHRFYPGVAAGGSFPALEGGSSLSGSIDAPEGTERNPDEGANGSGSRFGGPRNLSAPRATRVIGQFDHPILPMPPVSLLILFTVLALQYHTAY